MVEEYSSRMRRTKLHLMLRSDQSDEIKKERDTGKERKTTWYGCERDEYHTNGVRGIEIEIETDGNRKGEREERKRESKGNRERWRSVVPF